MTGAAHDAGALDRYTAASERAAGRIIDAYSTSFGAACRLLGPRHRTHVRNVYALVRVADELVDGATDEAGIPPEQQHLALSRLEAETGDAIASGYSSNPIVHAFAHTARAAGIDAGLVRPFFASMRADLPPAECADADPVVRFDERAHRTYVYGSAEVVGLMCLRVFLRDATRTPDELTTLEHGARRLGAAFQNVNFLRDLADDTERLGRSYLSANGRIDAEEQQRWVAVIRAQLADAEAAIPLLPRDARLAVTSALLLFSRLTDRLARTPAAELYERRIRVPAAQKAWLFTRAALDVGRERVS
ncbi:phytoene synthase [Microbacterium mangrovi]|uniref:Phytoene synthase n=1 Tax=Microbacterium mangrovi TaxID=1348253 RepID=A0A0B2A6M7_9MICO|nr:squalene/phytoene synthase family protein [Microbacterium mangrovi]KHK98720.1 phytoene synthase [Microbacterium mangrovi]